MVMQAYQPNYENILQAARRLGPAHIPLYDHIIAESVMEEILGEQFADLCKGDERDVEEYFRCYCEFYRRMRYDTVSYEGVMTGVLPGGGALLNSSIAAIRDRADFERYPFDQLEEIYFKAYGKHFAALRNNMPAGMKAIGGVGNGIFECVQDLTGYERLCYLRADDPELYGDLFCKIGDVLEAVWRRLLKEYGDVYCLCRFGDDLGFRTATLLSPQDIRELIIPQYKRIINLVHGAGKPFLLHSCGRIFGVMEDLIAAGIDAKHSNEDAIAPFPAWMNQYGKRIALFGGIDTDKVCRLDRQSMQEYIKDLFLQCAGSPGWAFGTGNSVPDYVPVSQYLMMNEIACTMRDQIERKGVL